MRAFFSLEFNARHQASPSVPTRSFCESILFVRLEALRGSERRVVRIAGMVGLKLDETLFMFWKICWNNFLTSWRKIICLVCSLMKQQIFRWGSVDFVLYGDEETQFIVKLCCLKIEVWQLLKTSSPIWIRLLSNMVLIGQSISQLLRTEQQTCKVLLMELSKNQKRYSWLCCNLFLLLWFFVRRPFLLVSIYCMIN